MAGVIDIRRFSGLARSLPITAAAFWIGGLALAGFPLLAGFWSKDEIVHAALAGNMPWLGWVALFTAWLTAFYTFRMIFMAFHGRLRLPHKLEHAHESGPWMTGPLLLLALGAIFAGYAGVSFHRGAAFGLFEPHGAFHDWLNPVFAEAPAVPHAEGGHALLYISSAISLWGIFTAWLFYRRRPTIPMALALAFAPVHRILFNKYFVDELYDVALVRPLRRAGEVCHGLDRFFINGVLWLIALVPRAVGFGLKQWQTGAIQGYALGMVVGLAVIVWWMLVAT